jgi:hypothetical protein
MPMLFHFLEEKIMADTAVIIPGKSPVIVSGK